MFVFFSSSVPISAVAFGGLLCVFWLGFSDSERSSELFAPGTDTLCSTDPTGVWKSPEIQAATDPTRPLVEGGRAADTHRRAD